MADEYAFSSIYDLLPNLKRLEHYNNIISWLVKLTNCKSYLEIGLGVGENLYIIRDIVDICEGVDVNDNIIDKNNIIFNQMTSDDFFKKNNRKFDIVFIDGNHDYYQVKKDLDNSLNFLNKYGIIILHDTDPIDNILTNTYYCSDAYKIVDYINREHPELNVMTFPIHEAGLSFVMRKNDRRVFNFINKINLDHFEWGNINVNDYEFIKEECLRNIYEKYFEVEKNDIVVDIGAFSGDFTYSILNKFPSHCWVIEPIEDYFRLLLKNLKNNPVSFIRGAISDTSDKVEINYAGNKNTITGIVFKDFLIYNCIDKIDFLKVDCEGSEYYIFTDENINFLKNNVSKIACEFHLNSPDVNLKEKFRYFRDNILVKFKTYYVNSVDGVDIKWELFNADFIEKYTEILIYIDNR